MVRFLRILRIVLPPHLADFIESGRQRCPTTPAAQRAVILTKADMPSLDVLGWLLTLNTRYDEAERMLNRPLELDPQNASMELHLGMLYLQKENR